MMKFRIRRGYLVEIPVHFVGVITTKKTKRQRKSIAKQKVYKRKVRLMRDESFAFKTQEAY
jgi:hypothetical protein